jgi:small subunit ribosomal protein S16
MALKIRLKRMGNRNRPFYRLVVQDSSWKRDGKTVADVGWYDAVKQPAQLSFKEKEIYKWLSEGVQMTETARALLKRHGILGKFKSGEYKQVLENADAPDNMVVTLAGDEPKAKVVPAPAPVVEEPAAEAAPAEAVAEVSAEEPAEKTEA